MIPKIIHYCWFGKGEIPKIGLECIKSWQDELPEYEIRRWDESNFDICSCEFTQKAYLEKKYAFVSDYARLFALYEYGGVYLDIDEIVLRDFSPLLKNYNLVAGFETNTSVMMGLLAVSQKHQLIKRFMEVYENWDKEEYIANPVIFTELLKSKGLKLDGTFQELEQTIAIYPNDFFCCYDFSVYKEVTTENSYAIQKYLGSWTNGRSKKMHELLVSLVGEKNYLRLKKIKKKICNDGKNTVDK